LLPHCRRDGSGAAGRPPGPPPRRSREEAGHRDGWSALHPAHGEGPGFKGIRGSIMTDPKATQAAVSPTQPLLAASAADTATTRGDPEAPGETVDLSGEVRLGYAPTLAGDGDGPAAASASASAPG